MRGWYWNESRKAFLNHVYDMLELSQCMTLSAICHSISTHLIRHNYGEIVKCAKCRVSHSISLVIKMYIYFIEFSAKDTMEDF